MREQEHSESGYLNRALRRRLWIERIFGLVLISFLIALYLGVIPGAHRVTMIAVDGEPAVVVAHRADALELLNDIKEMSGLPAEKVEFAQKVTLHSVSSAKNPVLSEGEALGELTKKLTLITRASAVLVNGEVVIALPNQQEALRTLSLLMKEFSPPGDEVTTFFKQQVRIDYRAVSPERLYSTAEEAIAMIIEATAPQAQYTVKSGDSAWQIARDYGVSLARLAAANTEVDLERIRVGAKLNIPGELPPLTIVARREIEEEFISRSLTRTRRIRITYENGIEVRREVIGRTAPVVTRNPMRTQTIPQQRQATSLSEQSSDAISEAQQRNEEPSR